jgi:hypothetical protein
MQRTLEQQENDRKLLGWLSLIVLLGLLAYVLYFTLFYEKPVAFDQGVVTMETQTVSIPVPLSQADILQALGVMHILTKTSVQDSTDGFHQGYQALSKELLLRDSLYVQQARTTQD